MASPILHIKDSYYFEVPKFLWRCDYADKADFPSVWIKNDPQYQDWEAHLLYEQLPTLAKEGSFTVPSEAELMSSYHAWRDHDHANFGKPFDSYLETQADWFKPALENLALKQKWELTKDRLAGPEAVQAYKKETSIKWSDDKIAAYNRQLSGKILIPQPFGELRNMYERESGICISRFMIIEVVVFLVMVLIFSRLAKRIATGERPRGRVWNFFETFLLFIRDEIARSAIHDDHHHEEAFDPQDMRNMGGLSKKMPITYMTYLIGTLALAGIHMSPIPSLDYDRGVFGERVLRSVTANTRQDGIDLLREAAAIPITPRTVRFPLPQANQALQALKAGSFQGAAVLTI